MQLFPLCVTLRYLLRVPCLQPNNVLMLCTGVGFVAKLADVGLARYMPEDKTNIYTRSSGARCTLL